MAKIVRRLAYFWYDTPRTSEPTAPRIAFEVSCPHRPDSREAHSPEARQAAADLPTGRGHRGRLHRRAGARMNAFAVPLARARRHPQALLVLVCLAQFMVILDVS